MKRLLLSIVAAALVSVSTAFLWFLAKQPKDTLLLEGSILVSQLRNLHLSFAKIGPSTGAHCRTSAVPNAIGTLLTFSPPQTEDLDHVVCSMNGVDVLRIVLLKGGSVQIFEDSSGGFILAHSADMRLFFSKIARVTFVTNGSTAAEVRSSPNSNYFCQLRSVVSESAISFFPSGCDLLIRPRSRISLGTDAGAIAFSQVLGSSYSLAGQPNKKLKNLSLSPSGTHGD